VSTPRATPSYGWPNQLLEALFPYRRTSATVLLLIHVGWLMLLGRPWGCSCGDTLSWQAVEGVQHNSQHVADWYALLHFGFGMVVLLALRWLRPHWRRRDGALVALLSSTLWELAENTPLLIRLLGNAGNLAPDYHGDSIINSMADSGFVLLGFWLASRLRPAFAVAMIVGLELAVSLAIGDGWLLVVVRLAASGLRAVIS